VCGCASRAQLVPLVDVPGSHQPYRVSVRAERPDAVPFRVADEVQPTYLGSLAVSIPGDLLEAGRFVVTVEGVSTCDAGEKGYEQIQAISFDAAPAQ
jgi:hypothetical protein